MSKKQKTKDKPITKAEFERILKCFFHSRLVWAIWFFTLGTIAEHYGLLVWAW